LALSHASDTNHALASGVNAEELANRLKDVDPLPGKFGGAYWWLSASDDDADPDDGDAPW
jgi:hypothetical protein